MRPGYGLVRNETDVEQSFGLHTIPPRGFGELPGEVIASLTRYPIRELTVIQPDVGPQVFRRTEHMPFSPRFQERARGTDRR